MGEGSDDGADVGVFRCVYGRWTGGRPTSRSLSLSLSSLSLSLSLSVSLYLSSGVLTGGDRNLYGAVFAVRSAPEPALWFGVWVLGFEVWGLGCGVWVLGFGVCDLGFGVWGLGSGVWGLGFRVWGTHWGLKACGFWFLVLGLWCRRQVDGFQNNYFTEMCSGSQAGSCSRLRDIVYHQTLDLRVIKGREDTFLIEDATLRFWLQVSASGAWIESGV